MAIGHIWCDLLHMRQPSTDLDRKQLGLVITEKEMPEAMLGDCHMEDNGRVSETELPCLQQELDAIVP